MKAFPERNGWLCAALLLVSGHADAHIVAARLGDFYAGALHPLTDLQDIVLWIALALLAAFAGDQRARWLVALMPLGLLCGIWLKDTAGLGAPGSLGSAATMIALGLLLAAHIRTSTLALCAVGFGLGLMRGAVNSDGMVAETNRLLYAAGLAGAGYVVMTLVMAVAVAFLAPATQGGAGWRVVSVRVCGSWIAAIGLMLGGFALKNAAV